MGSKPRKWKRKGPKSTRAGCLLCKPWKDQAVKDTKDGKRVSQRRWEESVEQALREV